MWYLQIIPFFTKNIRILLPLLIVVGVILGAWWKIGNLEDQLASKDKEIVALKAKLEQEKLKLAYEKVRSSEAKLTIYRLEDTIKETNSLLEKSRVNEKELQSLVNKWKSKPPKEVIKYVKQIVKVKDNKNVTLQEYQNINKKISRLVYSEL